MGVGGEAGIQKFQQKDVLVFRGKKINFITFGLPRKIFVKIH